MNIGSVQPQPAPAFLPLRGAAGGSSFGDSLRAQVRDQVTQAIAGGLPGQPNAPSAPNAGRYAALQQSLLTGAASAPQQASGPWADVARSIGSRYLPPQVAELFASQMALESGNFDPDVISGKRVSPAGAEGIAQLMPSSYPTVNRTDPIASLNAAAQTMRDNLQQFGGDIGKALAAYNAGAGTVTNAVQRLGPAWESGLPAETRQYLSRLLGASHG